MLRDGFQEDKAFTLHQGDSLKLKDYFNQIFTDSALNEGVVDLTVTSPPYSDLKTKDYASEQSKQIGGEDSYSDYLENLHAIFKQVYDITKTNGTLWVIVNTFKKNGRVVQLPNDIIDICENLGKQQYCQSCNSPLIKHTERGTLECFNCDNSVDTLENSWTLHDVIIWNKKRARPYSKQKTFRNIFEYILVFKKKDASKFDFDRVRIADPREFAHWWVDWPERYHPRGKVPENIWEIVTPSQGKWGDLTIDHPAPFPPDLVERIVAFASDTGDIVFDPFAGTGMTIAQASVMDRQALGIELSEQYCEKFEKLQYELNSRWRQRKTSGETLDQQQTKLAQVIWGLRQLVYARKVLLKLRQDLETINVKELGINTIFVLGHDTDADVLRDRDSVETDIYFIFDDHWLDDQYRGEIIELLGRYPNQSPWNGFGVNSNLNVVSLTEFSRLGKAGDEWWEDERLYLYHGSEHYSFLRTVDFQEWSAKSNQTRKWREKFSTSVYPAMMSNIRVHINREGDMPILDADPLSEPPVDAMEHIQDEIDMELKRTSLLDF